MNQGGGTAGGASPARGGASEHHERRLERLIDRLPERLQKAIRWLRRPGLRWLRLVAGVLFIAGSFLSILPIFGIWMLPVGVVLLAEDIPAFRRLRDWLLDWIGRHRPHWLAAHDTPQAFNEGAEEVVKSFTDREKAFEAEFKRNQELRFRLTARRNRLFGLWAAARLGLPPGEEADVYARAVVAADLEAPGDGDVIGKVRADLDAKGIAVTEAELRGKLERAAAEARRQIAQSRNRGNGLGSQGGQRKVSAAVDWILVATPVLREGLTASIMPQRRQRLADRLRSDLAENGLQARLQPWCHASSV